jgi:hypothetical protein
LLSDAPAKQKTCPGAASSSSHDTTEADETLTVEQQELLDDFAGLEEEAEELYGEISEATTYSKSAYLPNPNL